MGNRAVVVFYEETTHKVVTSPAIYLHWNGGPESVYSFLKEMDRRGIRQGDLDYEAARFVQTVGDWMDSEERGTLSLGIFNGPDIFDMKLVHPIMSGKFDHGDNGWYLINRSKGTVIHSHGFEGTLEEAYESVKADSYWDAIADDFATIDARLYGVRTVDHEFAQAVTVPATVPDNNAGENYS